MDFGSATLLASSVFILIELTKQFIPQVKASTQLLGLTILVWCQVVPEVVAHSDWGHKQVVDGIALDTMNIASLVVVGVALAGLAAVAYKVVSAIPSIGENQPPQ